ncbi:MAG: hypothetical protein ACOC5T_04170, partial [Elusimicrobiota bacterium]
MEIQILSQEIVQDTSLNYEDGGDFILIKDRVLLSPGNWNGLDFKKEEIEKAFQKTDWSNKQNYALIYDHDERATNWLGNVKNIRILEDGTLIGDLEVFDRNIGLKLTKGGAKLGISAKLLGMENEKGEFVNFTFNNFSVVYEPACKKAYINLSKDEILIKLKELEKRVKELEGETGASNSSGDEVGDATTNQKIKYGKKKKKKEKMSDDEDEQLGEKYDKAVKEIKDSLRKQHPDWDEEKITSTAHAIAREKGIGDPNPEEKDMAEEYKIPEGAQGNAKKALEWKEKYKVSAGTSTGWARARQLAKGGTISESDIKEMNAWFSRHKGNEKIDSKYKDEPWKDNGYIMWLAWGGDTAMNWVSKISKNLSDLLVLKGGLNSVKMSEEEQEQPQTAEQTESAEESKETSEETSKEETKEETQEEESKESEELGSKLDKVLALLESFDKRIAKLEEDEKEESKEEESKKEELSQKEEPKALS